MLWSKRLKKEKEPRGGNLFREAFLPPKPSGVRRQSVRRVAPRRFPVVWLLWGVFLMTVSYVLFVSPFHSLEDISVSGTTSIPESRIIEFLRGETEGNFVGVFPKSNYFLFSPDRMERELLTVFPKLRDADVRKRFPDRIEVTLSERDRIPLFCSAGSCVLLHDDGSAHWSWFAERPENDPFLFRIEDTGGQPIVLGESVMGSETLARVLSFDRMFRESGVVDTVPRVVSPSSAAGEFRFTTTEGWDILVSADSVPETTVAALRVILSKEIPEERRSKLRYIDLRIEKKAFFSFIQEGPVSEAVEGDAPDVGNGLSEGVEK